MKIDEFAKLILFSERLEDKLFFPETLTESSYPALKKSPVSPSRESSFSFTSAKNKMKFPSLRDLEKNEISRATVLHFFANHELLALELMALAILRFPETDIDFRKSLAYTIRDEQKHMRFYLEGMQNYGLSFGEIALNDAFWRALSNVDTAMEFICGMSLTFEQANLDFSIFYQKIFDKIGDRKTSAYLEEVYLDELNHVNNGLDWFRKWKEPGISDWDFYKKQLKAPLNPMKAKGNEFSKEARLAAGLSDSFIQELFLYQDSKGKSHDLHIFNITAELESINLKKAITPKKSIQTLENDLDLLPWLICGKDDLLLSNKGISLQFLNYLKENKQLYPKIISKQDFLNYKQKIRELKPWAWSPKIYRIIDKKKKLINDRELINYAKLKETDLSILYSKKLALSDSASLFKTFRRNSYSPNRTIVINRNMDFIKLIKNYEDKLVIKSPYGASGNQNKIYSANEITTIEKYIRNEFRKKEELIIEPWLNKVFDFSFQYFSAFSKIKFLGFSRFITNQNGQYQSNLINNFNYGLEQEALEFIYSKTEASLNLIQFLAEKIRIILENNKALAAYRGPIGVDAFVYKERESRLMIRPIVEYNCRMNMGYLSLILKKKISKQSYGLFQIIKKENFKIDKHRKIYMESGKILRGDLICSDIYNAENSLALLSVYKK